MAKLDHYANAILEILREYASYITLLDMTTNNAENVWAETRMSCVSRR